MTPSKYFLLQIYQAFYKMSKFLISVNLRLQVNKENSADFKSVTPERAFADFLFGHFVLHLVVTNFMG